MLVAILLQSEPKSESSTVLTRHLSERDAYPRMRRKLV
jgi:hypothetical protein